MMEITSSDIFWVMQADAIRSTVGGLCLIALFASIIAALTSKNWGLGHIQVRAWRLAACALALATIAGIAFLGFYPTTKTRAAMIVLPTIANDERVQSEAVEIYELAKEAIKGASQ